MNNNIHILSFLLIFFISNNSFSQENILYKTHIYNSEIHSLTIHPDNKQFGYPIINLNDIRKLILEFDNINLDIKYYNYTFIYCNSDWTPSNLSKLEYINGFVEGEIKDYEPSFNTQTNYNHYTLTFPEEETTPFISGNYILFIYEDYDTEKPVITQRFCILDNKVDISGEVKRSSVVSEMDFSQEINFKIIDNFIYISTITDGLKVSVSQNHRQDNIITDISPDYISGNIYEFNNPQKLFFKAGNEYRYFNVKNYRYLNDRVAKIFFEKPYYIFELVHEKPEGYRAYSYAQDINGEYVITSDDVDNDACESEYVLVDFTMLSKTPLNNGDVYVYGALSNYEISEKYKMSYNYSHKAYELRLMLKQGFYNYMYVFAENKNSPVNTAFFEGNHYETENDYQIFVYYRKPGTEADELIGYKLLNSLKKI